MTHHEYFRRRAYFALVGLIALVYGRDLLACPVADECPPGLVCPIEAGQAPAAAGWFYDDDAHALRLKCDADAEELAQALVAERGRCSAAEEALARANERLDDRAEDTLAETAADDQLVDQLLVADEPGWLEPLVWISAVALTVGACTLNDDLGGPWWACPGAGAGFSVAGVLIRW